MNQLDPQWKVHLPNLLHEIGDNNPTMAAMRIPLTVTARILAQVAERSSQLNDPKLNELMCRLTLYEIADPASDGYDYDAEQKVYEESR